MTAPKNQLPDWLWNALQESPHQWIRFPYEGQWIEMRLLEPAQAVQPPVVESPEATPATPWGQAASSDLLLAIQPNPVDEFDVEDTQTELELDNEEVKEALQQSTPLVSPLSPVAAPENPPVLLPSPASPSPGPLPTGSHVPPKPIDPIHENPPPGFEAAPDFVINLGDELPQGARATNLMEVPRPIDDLDALLPIDNDATAVMPPFLEDNDDPALAETGEIPREDDDH